MFMLLISFEYYTLESCMDYVGKRIVWYVGNPVQYKPITYTNSTQLPSMYIHYSIYIWQGVHLCKWTPIYVKLTALLAWNTSKENNPNQSNFLSKSGALIHNRLTFYETASGPHWEWLFKINAKFTPNWLLPRAQLFSLF